MLGNASDSDQATYQQIRMPLEGFEPSSIRHAPLGVLLVSCRSPTILLKVLGAFHGTSRYSNSLSDRANGS